MKNVSAIVLELMGSGNPYVDVVHGDYIWDMEDIKEIVVWAAAELGIESSAYSPVLFYGKRRSYIPLNRDEDLRIYLFEPEILD